MTTENLIEALKAYQEHNRVRNDLDAYLYALGEWALGVEDLTKPKKEDFGGEYANRTHRPIR